MKQTYKNSSFLDIKKLKKQLLEHRILSINQYYKNLKQFPPFVYSKVTV
jgi:hypothetical protein